MLFIEKTKGQLAYLYRLKVNLEKRLRLMPEGIFETKKDKKQNLLLCEGRYQAEQSI